MKRWLVSQKSLVGSLVSSDAIVYLIFFLKGGLTKIIIQRHMYRHNGHHQLFIFRCYCQKERPAKSIPVYSGVEERRPCVLVTVSPFICLHVQAARWSDVIFERGCSRCDFISTQRRRTNGLPLKRASDKKGGSYRFFLFSNPKSL